MAVRHITKSTTGTRRSGPHVELGLRPTDPTNSPIHRSRLLLDRTHLDLIASWSVAILVVSLCVFVDLE
jgi:hypothetical protein